MLQAAHLRKELNLDLRVTAICTSEKMLLSGDGIALEGDWRAELDKV